MTQGETASARRDAGEILGVIEMRCDAGAVADPDGFQHRVAGNQAAGIIGHRKARQINGQGHRTGIQDGRALIAYSLTNAIEHLGEQSALGLEIEPIQFFVIREAAVDGRRCLKQRGWVATVDGLQISAHGLNRGAAGCSGGPVLSQAAQNRRAPARPYNLLKEQGLDVLPLGGGFSR